jgi:hypothetical protein
MFSPAVMSGTTDTRFPVFPLLGRVIRLCNQTGAISWTVNRGFPVGPILPRQENDHATQYGYKSYIVFPYDVPANAGYNLGKHVYPGETPRLSSLHISLSWRQAGE